MVFKPYDLRFLSLTADKCSASPAWRDAGRLEVLVEQDVPEDGSSHAEEGDWQCDTQHDVEHRHGFEAGPHAQLQGDPLWDGYLQGLPQSLVLQQCLHDHLQSRKPSELNLSHCAQPKRY